MPVKIFSGANLGLQSQIIEIEVKTSFGLKYFEIIGLPDKAVQESKERVISAIESSGFLSPHKKPKRVLVSLAPADLKKEGSLYDLPIALGYLLSEGEIHFNPKGKLFFGELGLDGSLKKIKGAILFSILAKEKGFSEIILPKENELEASVIDGIKIVGVSNLKEAIDYLEGKKKIEQKRINLKNLLESPKFEIDFSQIKGQKIAKRALEISAAGGHNVLMVGPPGAGKSLLARSITSILPPLSFEESLEVSKIYSLAGLLSEENPLILYPPFRAPHHTVSEVALIGGGNPPRPGEISLAHRGVLFLDEFPEFHRDVLESLRQPLEEKKITILRSKFSVTLPCAFTLICASNPCPCGNFGDPEKICKCSPSQVRKYQRKLSGPIVDRIDLLIEIPSLKFEEIVGFSEENVEEIREKIKLAREIQRERLGKTNSEMNVSEIEKYCQIDEKSKSLLKKAVDQKRLSMRGYHRVLKVARTIADLEEKEKILFDHVAEALSFRVKEFSFLEI